MNNNIEDNIEDNMKDNLRDNMKDDMKDERRPKDTKVKNVKHSAVKSYGGCLKS